MRYLCIVNFLPWSFSFKQFEEVPWWNLLRLTLKELQETDVYRPFSTLFIHGAQILFANLKHIHFSNERRWVWRSFGGLCRIYSVKEFTRPLYLGRFGPLFTPICSGRNIMAGNGKSRQFFGALCTRCSHKLCQLALILRIYNIPYYF